MYRILNEQPSDPTIISCLLLDCSSIDRICNEVDKGPRVSHLQIVPFIHAKYLRICLCVDNFEFYNMHATSKNHQKLSKAAINFFKNMQILVDFTLYRLHFKFQIFYNHYALALATKI